jgi:hypothetical protein
MTERRLGARAFQASVECPREGDVLEAVAFGRWPQHCDPLLAAHVARCAVCADVLEVAISLRDDREWACREAQLPTAGAVWWRATIRARADAARTAMQPVSVLEAIAGAVTLGLTAGLASIAWRSIHWADRLSDMLSRLAVSRSEAAATSSVSLDHALLVVFLVAACLVLAPIALYITLGDE